MDPDNRIVRYPDFDNAIVKVIGSREDELTDVEEAMITRFLKPVSGEQMSTALNLSLADEILSAKRCKRLPSKYINLQFIPPTSNVAERLFSSAKHILTETRKHMHHAQFETIIFLRVNKAYWGVRSLLDTKEYLLQ